MAYEKPPVNNIPFEFTTGGYIKPDFNDISFNFALKPTFQQTANLQAIINAVAPKDLPASITGVSLSNVKNLPSSILGYPPVDLGGYTKIFTEAVKDLGAFASAVPPVDLPASLIGILLKGTIDLGGILDTIPPEDLPASVFGFLPVDLPASIFPEGFVNLLASINPGEMLNLPSFIKPFVRDYKNLGAIVDIISVYNLPSIIHGFDTRDLGTSVTGAYGPYDMQASITGTGGFKNMLAYLKGMLGVRIPVDLPATMEGWYTSDLSATTNAILSADLTAYINATGKSINLPATIIPKVIYLSQALQIALLEHKNLNAVINIPCFGTGHINLPAYIRSIEKLDLKAYIAGWNVDLTTDGIVNLGAAINAAAYYVEDKVDVRFVPDAWAYSQLKIRFNSTGVHTVFDTFDVIFGAKAFLNLSATVASVLESIDLGASITTIFDWNYSELPDFVSPKSHTIVIKFTPGWREQWRKFVEIFFDFTGETPYHYFYVGGADKVYRVDRTRHWTIWVKSYDETGGFIERRNQRSKYIFRVSQYATMDEAITDFIDRVSAYREVELGARINGILDTHLDLGVYINPDVKYTWVKHLSSVIKGQERVEIDMPTYIFAELYKGQLDMPASITPTDYTPPSGDSLVLNFEGSGYTPPPYDETDMTWTAEDAE